MRAKYVIPARIKGKAACTDARWPNFGKITQKRPQKYFLAGKNRPILSKGGRKHAEKYFVQFIGGIPFIMPFSQRSFINKSSKTVNQEQVLPIFYNYTVIDFSTGTLR
jgi:hypothetical protein